MMLALASCYEDKGNYSYDEIPTISIENIEPSYTCLRKADLLEITPKITSTIEGEITPDNRTMNTAAALATWRIV